MYYRNNQTIVGWIILIIFFLIFSGALKAFLKGIYNYIKRIFPNFITFSILLITIILILKWFPELIFLLAILYFLSKPIFYLTKHIIKRINKNN